MAKTFQADDVHAIIDEMMRVSDGAKKSSVYNEMYIDDDGQIVGIRTVVQEFRYFSGYYRWTDGTIRRGKADPDFSY